MQQVLLRDLGAKARERPENLQPAAHHHKQRNRIDPVAQPHNKWMLVNRTRHHDGLGVFPFCLNDFDDATAHFLTSPDLPRTRESRRDAGATITIRKTTNTPGLPSSQLCPARA